MGTFLVSLGPTSTVDVNNEGEERFACFPLFRLKKVESVAILGASFQVGYMGMYLMGFSHEIAN